MSDVVGASGQNLNAALKIYFVQPSRTTDHHRSETSSPPLQFHTSAQDTTSSPCLQRHGSPHPPRPLRQAAPALLQHRRRARPVHPPPASLRHHRLTVRWTGRRATPNRSRSSAPSTPSRGAPRATPPRTRARQRPCSSTCRAPSTGLASARSRRTGRGSSWRRFVVSPSEPRRLQLERLTFESQAGAAASPSSGSRRGARRARDDGRHVWQGGEGGDER